MKKVFLMCVIVLTVSGATLNAQTWNIGTPTATDVTATFTGSLAISGTGKMQNFTARNTVPWYNAISKMSRLITLDIQSGVTNIGNWTFSFPNITGALNIPASITAIGANAFWGCINLTSVTIPDSVTEIGDSAFKHCRGLKSITCQNPVPSQIILGNDVFYDVNKTICILKVPAGSAAAYQMAAQWQDFIIIEESATAVENVELQNLTIYVANGELIIVGDVPFDNLPFTILDLTGKQIVNGQCLNGKLIKVANLATGVYFVKITTDKGTVTKKFVKE